MVATSVNSLFLIAFSEISKENTQNMLSRDNKSSMFVLFTKQLSPDNSLKILYECDDISSETAIELNQAMVMIFIVQLFMVTM